MTRKGLSNLLTLVGLGAVFAVSWGLRMGQDQTVVVQLSGLRSAEGVVHVLLYDNADAFHDGSIVDLAGFAVAQARAEAMTVAVRDIAPGDYAVMVHHDENANDVFEHRGQMPLEGWGYSNNVGQHTLPSFASATVTFHEGAEAVDITVLYAN